MDTHPVTGEQLYSTIKELTELEQGTLLKPYDSEDYDGVALKATTFEWAVTGHSSACSSEELLEDFAEHWVKVGQI